MRKLFFFFAFLLAFQHHLEFHTSENGKKINQKLLHKT